MNPSKTLLIFSLYLLSSISIFSQTIQVKSAEVNFTADTRFGDVKGTFKTVKITSLDTKKNTAVVEIDTASINTGNGMRDKHLQADEFFDVANYPKATFILESLTKDTEDSFTAKGKLTIKNISKDLSFPVTLTKTETAQVYSGSVKVSRKEFQMTYNNFINPIQDTILVTIQASLESK